MPTFIGYLGKLPIFHVFKEDWRRGEFRLDCSLCYVNVNYYSDMVEVKKGARKLLNLWLEKTGLIEED